MPRINIEDSIFRDLRFGKLISTLGSQEAALGAMVMAWMIAQRAWTKYNDRLIPLNEWELLDAKDALIACRLAKVTESGKIYVSGSKTQFAWLTQRQNAGRKNKGKSRKRKETDGNGRERVETSSSFSSSLSFSSSDSSSKRFPEDKKPSSAAPELNRKIWESYSSAYFQRYGTEPVRNATVNAQISQVGKRLGEEAVFVAEFYLTHGDAYYVKTMHTVGILLKDCEKLRTEWKTNRKVTTTLARQQERTDFINEVFKSYLEKKEEHLT